jgi:hypothetical protein
LSGDDSSDFNDDNSDTSSVHSIESEADVIYVIEDFVCVRGGVRYPAHDRRTLHFRD